MIRKISDIDLQQCLCPVSCSLLEAIKRLATQRHKIVFVLAAEGRLQGTLVDGDVRRALLRGVALEAPISQSMFRQPWVIRSKDELGATQLALDKAPRYIPLINAQGHVLAVYDVFASVQVKAEHPNIVVLMAGGLGSRLGSLTRDCPKPMLKLGGKPILQHILEKFIHQGFCSFYISVNYKREVIEHYFGDGQQWGVSIRYLRETKRLGTAGALSLIQKQEQYPIIVMNGDVLADVDFDSILDFHVLSGASITSVLGRHQEQIPFGVATVCQNRIVELREKPLITYYVSAGIYVLDPKRVHDVPADTFYDMPDLLQRCIEEGDCPAAYPLHEHWQDIGRPEELERAIVYTG